MGGELAVGLVDAEQTTELGHQVEDGTRGGGIVDHAGGVVGRAQERDRGSLGS